MEFNKSIEKDKQAEKKRFDWASVVNDISTIVQIAQFVSPILALVASLFGADFIRDTLKSSWAVAITAIILYILSFILVKPTFKFLVSPKKTPTWQNHPLLRKIPDLNQSGCIRKNEICKARSRNLLWPLVDL